jgi:hypothetical protein
MLLSSSFCPSHKLTDSSVQTQRGQEHEPPMNDDVGPIDDLLYGH